ncbi:DUF3108 domain-containing protein [Caminibacter mediatlanticus TB-2]|uniref:DUF3108 domain-containing protein n=1 Tax=Caminibacter mediatlanticus TB-2 TaxID=391592 RepID=A0ABX5VAI3_9BACT|nr:DUF3108 domain-containing protein [Caminibacter mediatlanticus]QCT93801.1 DUF3108 domain-containing protein [Caminibacter mediatlanticus TB-2]
MRIILLLFCIVFLNATKIEATYSAKYGWFGTIATAKGIFERNNTNYQITTTVNAKGIAAALSGNLMQTYKSIGIIKNGLLIPQKYIVDIKRNGNDYYRVHIFNHKKKEIIKIRYKNGKLTKKYKIPYAPYDVLSLYWNLPKLIKEKKHYTFYAIGGRKKDGRIDITFPNKEEINQLKKSLKKSGLYIKANLYNKVFVGDKGVLYLVINPKNWVTLAGMVKNVLKIGDLKGEIKSLKKLN